MSDGKGTRRREAGPGGFVLWSTLLFLGMSLLGGAPSTLKAQSIVGGVVAGEVFDEAGLSIRGASIALLEKRSGTQWMARTRSDGAYAFEYVPGGIYELRIEALGYRPVVVTDVAVSPGDQTTVRTEVVAEPPPLTRVDTVPYTTAGRATPLLGRRVDWTEISAVPDRTRDLAGLLSLSSWSDLHGGLEGLPAGFTSVFVDGEPHRVAQHPALLGTGAPLGLVFPRVGLQSAKIMTGMEDVEWSGSAGGVVALETRPPLARSAGEGFGLWAGGPTWSNEVVADAPSFMSAWGGGAFSFSPDPRTRPIAVAIEGALVETPNVFWRDDFIAQRFDDRGTNAGLRRLGHASGLVRGAWGVGEEGELTLRAGYSVFRSESDREGVTQVGYGTELPGEGSDGSVAGVLAFPLGERLHLEVRGSGSMSSRSWGELEGAVPGAILVSDRGSLGSNPAFPATSDRVDLSLTPVFHFRSGPNRLKAGARMEYSSFDMVHGEQATGAFLFGSREGLLAGRGAGAAFRDPAPSETFGVSRATIFGQYWWSAGGGLDVVTGISWKVENLPLADTEPVPPWIGLTGISNVSDETTLSAVDGRVQFRWDLRENGRTWFIGGLGVEHSTFDPAALYEVLSLDGGVDVQRFVGSGLDWESGRIPEVGAHTGNRLALFARKLEAPRTSRAAVGLFHTFGRATRIGVSGSLRRTESILRRSDLNRLLVPSGTDQDGRPLFGELQLVSGVLAADPQTNRRFPGLESVWALSPDGWSEYRGVTASLDTPLGERGLLSLSYSWSETTDNWLGAARGSAFAQLNPALAEGWDEAPSDFDAPHRMSVFLSLPLPLPWGGSVAGLYSLRSDFPFTPKVAAGLDANGDGSPLNDVAFVPSSGGGIEDLAQEWSCIADALGSFAPRNSCRGDPIQSINLRLSLGLPSVGGVTSRLVVDGLNLTDVDMGIRDDNLVLLGSGVLERNGEEVRVPYRVNPEFGGWAFRGDTGRMLRIGLSIGGGAW